MQNEDEQDECPETVKDVDKSKVVHCDTRDQPVMLQIFLGRTKNVFVFDSRKFLIKYLVHKIKQLLLETTFKVDVGLTIELCFGALVYALRQVVNNHPKWGPKSVLTDKDVLLNNRVEHFQKVYEYFCVHQKEFPLQDALWISEVFF